MPELFVQEWNDIPRIGVRLSTICFLHWALIRHSARNKYRIRVALSPRACSVALRRFLRSRPRFDPGRFCFSKFFFYLIDYSVFIKFGCSRGRYI